MCGKRPPRAVDRSQDSKKELRLLIHSGPVRGADTDRLDLAPQCPGLLAVSLGMSALHQDDHAMLGAMLPVYDALYAWRRQAQSETHSWNPLTMKTAA
jgi:hypothetical protein